VTEALLHSLAALRNKSLKMGKGYPKRTIHSHRGGNRENEGHFQFGDPDHIACSVYEMYCTEALLLAQRHDRRQCALLS
jgi:hypothetical protein